MINAKMVSREVLANKFMEDRSEGKILLPTDSVEIVQTAFGSNIPKSGAFLDAGLLSVINKRKSLSHDHPISFKGNAQSGFDIAFNTFKHKESIMQQIKRGYFSGQSLNDNWTDLQDAERFDLSLKKAAKPTVRQYFYNIIDKPNATIDVRPTELYPYGFVFEENNGQGQSVKQGANMLGGYGTIAMQIFSAGFTWDLLASLFDGSYDLTRMNEGVTLAYSAKQDDLAISEILDYASYSTAGTAKHTAASSVGDTRQEYLLNTLMDAVDDLAKRVDPVTNRPVGRENLSVLCSTTVMGHIEHVNGLPSDRNRNYPSIRAISNIVGYDGEVINMPDGTTTYSGVGDTYCYIVKKNRYMNVVKKTGLIAEIDKTPDVPTLSREQRAWYFSEGIQIDGVASFVQKVTLPAW